MAKAVPPSIPPTLQPHQAIPLIKRQLDRLDEVVTLHWNDPQVDGWKSTTESILDDAFGMPAGSSHPKTQEFRSAGTHPARRLPYGIPPAARDRVKQESYLSAQRHRKVLLEAFIEQLQDLAPPSAATAPDPYRFHSEVERASGQLYRNGHYREAALNAYIRVIEEVRQRSGLAEDGDPLMNRAFGFERQTPAIQFNDLTTEAERDEQKGIMFLFKGVVGLRNSKAHSLSLFNDPQRGHDYLALASLLMRLLEIRRYNQP